LTNYTLRGGSWLNNSFGLFRVAYRHWYVSDFRSNYIGLRIAFCLQGVSKR